MDRTALEHAGIDVEDALARLMGNEMLLERLMRAYLVDPQYENLRRAFAEHDMDGAISATHALKGTCGNLSMVRLASLVTRQLELLRADSWDEAAALMPHVDEAYAAVVDAIKGA